MLRDEAIAIIRKEYLCVDRDCGVEKNCGKCDLVMPSKEPILEAFKMAIRALEHEPCDVTYTNAGDMISRKAAIEAINYICPVDTEYDCILLDKGDVRCVLSDLPSVQPTLYGYDIEHLILIADVLRKENLPPERVANALTDIGRIVSIVSDEFEESLRKAVEQWKI